MKTCLICGRECADQASTCPDCGEASFWKDVSVKPAARNRVAPRKSVLVDSVVDPDPFDDGGDNG